MQAEAGENDLRLIEAVSARDASALGTLYDRYSGLLFPLCLRILRARPDAEELLGDVFWELWSHPGRYDPLRGSLRTFLLTLTRNRAIDRLRSGRARRRTEGASEESTAATPATAPGGSPLGEALASEQRSRILGALAELEPRQRRAIELSFYEGLTHSEISESLGEPLGTVKGRIRLGLIRLRDSLRSHYESGGLT